MLEKLRRALRGNSGFTILELIVVIAIMGFLIALVAPKLAGVADTAKSPTCSTNQQRLSEAIERNITEKGNIPNGLTNLIPDETKMASGLPLLQTNASGDKNKWIFDEDSKANAIFSQEFAKKNHLTVHKLNKAEIDEIKKLGITHLIDYKTGAKKAIGTAATEIDHVLMIGSGASTSDSTPSETTDRIKAFSSPEEMTNPELMYRIVLGVGEYSDLAEEGIVESIGKCPTSMQNKAIEYKNYSIVLPKLDATVDRLDNKGAITFTGGTGGKSMKSLSTDFINAKQEKSLFSVLCPEGDLWPEPKVDSWKK